MPKIVNAQPRWYNNVKYRSKLEASCAEILDNHKIKFKYEPFKMVLLPEFTYKGKTILPWTYTPDFVIFDNIIIEAKGFKDADNYRNKRKVILKHLLDNNLEYEFCEIYAENQLESILKKTEKDNLTFMQAYNQYFLEYETRRKERKRKKNKNKKLKNNESA